MLRLLFRSPIRTRCPEGLYRDFRFMKKELLKRLNSRKNANKIDTLITCVIFDWNDFRPKTAAPKDNEEKIRMIHELHEMPRYDFVAKHVDLFPDLFEAELGKELCDEIRAQVEADKPKDLVKRYRELV